MRRSVPAADQLDGWCGLSRGIPSWTLVVALFAFGLFCGDSVADEETGDDSEAATNVDSPGWLGREYTKFRKYPYIERAERLIGAGESAEAAEELKRVLELDPEDSDVRLRLVELFLGPLNAPDLAKVQASKVIEQGRKLGLGYYYRALANYQLGDTDAAVSDWMGALDNGELSADRRRYVRRQLVDIAIKLGDFAAIPPLLEDDAADLSFEDRLILARAYRNLDHRTAASSTLIRAVRETEDVPPDGWLRVAQFQMELGKPALATLTIQRGLETVESETTRRQLATFLGHLQMQRGRPDQAAFAFALAAEEGGPGPDLSLARAQALSEFQLTAQALEVLKREEQTSLYGQRLHAQLLTELGRPEDAAHVLENLLDDPSHREDWGTIALEAAELYAKAGDLNAQMATLEQAVLLAPEYTPSLRALAERQIGAGHLSAASVTLRQLIAVEDRPEERFRLVDVLLASRDHQAAMVELRRLDEDLPVGHPERERVLRQLATLAETEREWGAAARAWEALYLADGSSSPELLLQAGRAARLGNQPELAHQLLAKTASDTQEWDLLARLFDERARLALMEGDLLAAAEAQQQAVIAEPTAERHYRMAQLSTRLGQAGAARQDLVAAVVLAPGNAEYQASLGYAYLQDGNDQRAAQHFEAALAEEPWRLRLYEELGYVYKRLGRDEAAAKAFRQRIDLAQTQEAGAASSGFQSEDSRATGTDETNYRLRSEVQQLEERLRINAGLFVRRMQGGDASDANSTLGLTGFQSQAGVDIGYRLDNVSDGRFVEVFGRSLWAFEDDTLSAVGSQTQGGLGLRVKPFAPINFFLSGERLIALGSNARDDWLLRASASFNRGSAYAPAEQTRHYRSVYLDAAKVVQDNAEFLVGEWREGVAFRIGQGLNLVAYGVASATYTDDIETERRRELGPGIALRGWLGGDTYHTYSSHFELGLEYREVVGGNTDEDSGVVVRMSLRL